MPFGIGFNGANQSNKTSATSIVSSLFGSNSPVGSLMIVAVSANNQSTTDGNTSEVTSVTDTAGNSYTKIRELCNSQGAADAGITLSVWMATLAVGLDGSVDTITANFSAATTAKVIRCHGFTVDAGKVANPVGVQEILVDAASGVGTPSITGLASEDHLHWICIATESNAEATSVTGYDDGGVFNTTGGSTATNIACRIYYKVGTSTGDTPATTPSEVADKAALFIIFNAITPRKSFSPTFLHTRPRMYKKRRRTI